MPAPEVFPAGKVEDTYPAIAGVPIDHQRTDEPPPAAPVIAER